MTPMAPPNAVGIGGEVVAGDPDLAVIRLEQGGEDVDHGGLAGAVRPEQREHGAFGDGQVDTVEDHVGAERLADADRGDRRRR